MTGSTGNIYHVHVARIPTCTCPHSRKGNQCKHLIYVMSRVLRARFDLVYQLALLASELREIFDHAPSIRIDGEDGGTTAEGGEREDEKNRKSIEGDCPICFTPFEGPDDTVYCRAQCGQNMHKECFEMWAATKRKSPRDKVTCPFCRTPWQGDDDVVKKIQNTGIVGDEGYVNIADQLGVSRHRGMPNNIYLLTIFPWLLTSSCRWQHLLWRTTARSTVFFRLAIVNGYHREFNPRRFSPRHSLTPMTLDLYACMSWLYVMVGSLPPSPLSQPSMTGGQ